MVGIWNVELVFFPSSNRGWKMESHATLDATDMKAGTRKQSMTVTYALTVLFNQQQQRVACREWNGQCRIQQKHSNDCRRRIEPYFKVKKSRSKLFFTFYFKFVM